MTYVLGIDVGTTFTAAALARGGVIEMVSLGIHQVVAPTVIFASGDELAYGAAAVRRGQGDPKGVAVEFKRRVGDPVPLILSGTPYAAGRLVALFARWVTETVAEQLGGPAETVVMTHPANWTQFQLDHVSRSLDEVGVGPVVFVTEPEAAAIDFAAAGRVEPDEMHLVYDLGGGTFDVALLRRSERGFDQIGDAAGLERLGGIDFDEAIFQFVLAQLPDDEIGKARGDPDSRRAIGALRRACTDAKEGLSTDLAVDIPIILPQLTTTVRLTRREFEDMITPSLRQTIDAVRRMLGEARVEPHELAGVLLVGGTSRIPLVAELVRNELGVTCRVDAHPKLVVVRGAARWGAMEPSGVVARAAPEDRRSYRRPLIVGAMAAGVAGVAAVGVIALTGGGDEDPQRVATSAAAPSTEASTTSPSTTSTAPATSTTESPQSTVALPSQLTSGTPVSVPAFPDTIASDGEHMWLTLTTAGQLAQLDPVSGVVLDTIDVGPDPVDIAYGHGALWVTVRAQNAVLRIDPRTREMTTIDLGRNTGNVAIGSDAVWVTMVDVGLVRIDPVTLAPEEVPVDIPEPGGVFVTDDAVWVAQKQDDVVVRVDPASGTAVGAPLTVGADPDPVVENDGVLWVGNRGDGTVSRIDLATGAQVVAPVPGGPADIAVDGRRVWVVCADGGTLELLDQADASPVISETLGGRPLSVLALGDGLWITLAEASAVLRVDVG